MAPTQTPEEKAFEEARRGFQYRQYRDNATRRVHQVSEDMNEMYQIRAREPVVSLYKFSTPGQITLSLKRSSIFVAHVEGIVCHVTNTGSISYQMRYRSDGGGFETTLDVKAGDVIGIGMELHHFVSEVVPHGTSEMDVTVTYI